MSKKKPAKDQIANQSIVTIGKDETGKPRAAKFSMSQKDLVLKAAGLMNLEAYEVDNATFAEHLTKIPAGRLYSNGRGFVPYVRRDRYAKIREALALPAESESSETPPIAKGFPANWDEIENGHLVIAQSDAATDGWWEAVVMEVEGDMLTLRWRDYRNFPKLVRHRTAVALLNAPTEQSPAQT